MVDSWLYDGEAANHSSRTIGNRRDRLNGLLWFLKDREYEECGVEELREFFVYLRRGHQEPGGRFGIARLTKPVGSSTVASYYSSIRTLFNFAVSEGKIDASPMSRVKVPVNRPDQIQPFTESEAQTLIEAAKRTAQSSRNEAIVYLLLDTGIRAEELCLLRVADVDLDIGRVTVQGKGGKRRVLAFSRKTRRAMFNYLSERETAPDDRVFLGERGSEAGASLTRHGLGSVIRKLGKRAGLSGVRCSPHTFRHTFAILFLRAGGDVFTLKTMLGHESLAMTNRYVAIAQADIAAAHRQFSPVAHLGKRS